MTKFIQSLSLPGGNEDDGVDTNKLRSVFPNFLWVLRDVHLTPEIDGVACDFDTYLTKKVLKPGSSGFTPSSLVKRAILSAFPDIQGIAIPAPSAKQEVIQNMDKVSDADIEPGFIVAMKAAVEKIIDSTKIKHSLNGNNLTGEGIHNVSFKQLIHVSLCPTRSMLFADRTQ